MKKLLCIILSLALLLGLVPPAFADGEVPADDGAVETENVQMPSESELVEEYLNKLYRSGKISGGTPSFAALQLETANEIIPYGTMSNLSRLSNAVQDIDYVIYNFDQSSSLCYYVVIYYGNAEEGEPVDAWEFPCSDFPVGVSHLGVSWSTVGEEYPNGSYTAYSFVAKVNGDSLDIDEESFLGFEIELTGQYRLLKDISLVNTDTGESYDPGSEIEIKPGGLLMLSIVLDPGNTTDNRAVRVSCFPEIDGLSVYELGGTVVLEAGAEADGSGTLQVGIGPGMSFSFKVTAANPIPEAPKELFVNRLYEVCLERQPNEDELEYYLWLMTQDEGTGTDIAYRFLFSGEFVMKNYCDRHYAAKLYEAMMGRTASDRELDNWAWRLQKGATREQIFNEFASSKEFRNICTHYRIRVGEAVAIPARPSRPGGYCTVEGCAEHRGKVDFATRLYNVCLNREPSQKEIDSWHYFLVHGDYTGLSASRFFLFSEEFISKGYSDEEFVQHLYDALLDRNGHYDRDGVAYWVWLLSDMKLLREEVFDKFAENDEFSVICQSYGVVV